MHSTVILHIRKSLLRVTQGELAEIAGTTQATVSRWEKDQLGPSLSEAGRISAELKRRGIEWDDRQFFESPPTAPAQADEQPKVA